MAAVFPIAWLEFLADVAHIGDSDPPAASTVHHADAQRRGLRFQLVLANTGFQVIASAPLAPFELRVLH